MFRFVMSRNWLRSVCGGQPRRISGKKLLEEEILMTIADQSGAAIIRQKMTFITHVKGDTL